MRCHGTSSEAGAPARPRSPRAPPPAACCGPGSCRRDSPRLRGPARAGQRRCSRASRAGWWRWWRAPATGRPRCSRRRSSPPSATWVVVFLRRADRRVPGPAGARRGGHPGALPGLRRALQLGGLGGGGRHRALQRGRRDRVRRFRARARRRAPAAAGRRSTAWRCSATICRPTPTWPSPAGRPCPFPLARLRARRVVEIGEDRWRSTAARRAELLARSLGVEPTTAVAGLHRPHRGLGRGADPRGPVRRTPSGRAGPSAAHFDYLAEEVLARQPRRSRTSCSTPPCSGGSPPSWRPRSPGARTPPTSRARLVARHLFTVRLDTEGEWYRYHHLFQALPAAAAWPSATRRRCAERHRRAAAWWSAAGQPAEAVRHLLEAGDQRRRSMPSSRLPSGCSGPRGGDARRWLDAIPRAALEDRPASSSPRPGFCSPRAARGRFAEAEQAIDRLIDAGDHDRAATAIVRLQQTMVTAGTSPATALAVGRALSDGSRPTPACCRWPHPPRHRATATDAASTRRGRARGRPAPPAAGTVPCHRAYARRWRASTSTLAEGPDGRCGPWRRRSHELEARDPEDRLASGSSRGCSTPTCCSTWADSRRRWPSPRRLREDFRRLGVEGPCRRSYTWIVWTALAGLGRWDELGAQFEAPRPGPGRGDLLRLSLPRPRARSSPRPGGRRRGGGAHRGRARRDARVRGDVRRVLVPLRLRDGRPRGGPHRPRPRAGTRRARRRPALGSPWAHARAALVAGARRTRAPPAATATGARRWR